ncbi:hypothetical protein ACOTJC_29005 [Achromobacter xylosoxidans]|uniref:hypothetical protein n=1 Tax=Alcaligenes xylosoxydans xylosoxydans TaxID=85698 RepID=UPI002E19BE9C|nr:hypothetical protein [Achromobacter xylosoxidans]
MASAHDIFFSVNRYDCDGDLIEEGIFLHFGDTSVKAADSFRDFRNLPGCIQSMVDEIAANYLASE